MVSSSWHLSSENYFQAPRRQWSSLIPDIVSSAKILCAYVKLCLKERFLVDLSLTATYIINETGKRIYEKNAKKKPDSKLALFSENQSRRMAVTANVRRRQLPVFLCTQTCEAMRARISIAKPIITSKTCMHQGVCVVKYTSC